MKIKTTNKFVKKLPSIIGIIVCILLVPILIMNVTIIIKSYLYPDRVPDFFGIKPFVVITGSMEPEIMSGDLVVTKTVDPATLKVNDIIAYKSGNVVITHRIVEITTITAKPFLLPKATRTMSRTKRMLPIRRSRAFICLGLGK